MSATTGAIVRRGGISRTIFVISLVIVAVAAGLGGYFSYGFLHPSPVLTLTGSGSTLVYPLMSAWASSYNSMHSSVQINYGPVGSSTGITDFTNKIVDFAGTDAAPTAASLVGLNATLTIPETIGAVTMAYNVQGLSTGLHFNRTVIAEIFQGNITNWSSSDIQHLNPGITLPNQPITTVHRSDGSGTTFIFTSYLSTASNWKFNPPSKSWPSIPAPCNPTPCALGGNGNQQVATDILSTPYSIGYVEVAYALQNNMNIGYIQNHDNSSFVKPTLANITSAVSSYTASFPPGSQSWSAVSLINEPGANSYPIVSFTYLLVYQQLNLVPLMTIDRAKALVDFLWYIIHQQGQTVATGLTYAALPQAVVTIDETTIQSITFNGQTLPT
jgi:phosphate transport system substrate-binding protein